MIYLFTLPNHCAFTTIEVCKTNTIIGYQHEIKIGDRCIIAFRKYTWTRRVAKTSYMHIYYVDSFENKKVIEHWREQKDGTFKTI